LNRLVEGRLDDDKVREAAVKRVAAFVKQG
jgi:hypothetical protein